VVSVSQVEHIGHDLVQEADEISASLSQVSLVV